MSDVLIPPEHDTAFGVSLFLCLIGVPLMAHKKYRDVGILLTGAGMGGTINIIVHSQRKRVRQ